MLDFYYENTNKYMGYGHSISQKPQSPDFHCHDEFEIYFFICGDVNYFIEKKVYHLKHGDLLVMNSNEIHKPTFVSDSVYERITIHFDPTIVRMFNSPGFDILRCFTGRPRGELNKINLNSSQIEEIMKKFKKLENANKNPSNGFEILKLTYFIELLVFINQVFSNIKPVEEKHLMPEKLVPVLEYIEGNIDGDLSLEQMETMFYINRYYLSRLFKKSTGINIHEYILSKRVTKAKELLNMGFNVTDSCQRAGFNDYANFIRMFKKTVGISPGRYRKTNEISVPHTMA